MGSSSKDTVLSPSSILPEECQADLKPRTVCSKKIDICLLKRINTHKFWNEELQTELSKQLLNYDGNWVNVAKNMGNGVTPQMVPPLIFIIFLYCVYLYFIFFYFVFFAFIMNLLLPPIPHKFYHKGRGL